MESDKMEWECSWKISWATFFANILILLHHANLKTYYPEKVTMISSGIMDFISMISIPAMVWFFFISAYLFFRKLDIRKIPEKWSRRIKSILIPFIIWNTVSVILEFAKGVDLNGVGVIDFFVKNYFFIYGSGCANGPLWYLFRLMEYIIIAPVIYFVIRKKWLTVLIEIILFVVNYVFGIGYFDFSYFLPVYVAGAYMGLNKADKAENIWSGKKIHNRFSSVVGTVFGIVAIIVFSNAVYVLPEPGKSIARYASVVGIFLLICSLGTVKPSPIVTGGGYVVLLHSRHCI